MADGVRRATPGGCGGAWNEVCFSVNGAEVSVAVERHLNGVMVVMVVYVVAMLMDSKHNDRHTGHSPQQ